MRAGARRALALALGLGLAAARPARPARADAPDATAPSDADRAFQHGREKLAAGAFGEACVAFEESERLDPQLGTRYNIAQCKTGLGLLVEALAIFRDLADHDTNPQRKAVSAKLAAQLAARLPHIHLRITHAEPDLVVLLDGVDVTGRTDDLAVDVGTHVVTTKQEGARTKTPVEVRAERASFDVAIDAIAPPARPDADPEADAGPAPPHRRAYLAFAVGGGCVVVGAVLGLLAHAKWNDAKAADATGDVASANSLASSARTRGDFSTGFFVLGGLGAAAGVALYLTAPTAEHAVRVTAAPTSGGAAVWLGGRF